MPKKIFVGVAWPYVNGDIHVGHLAGYLLPADIFARFHRYIGNDVLMVSGSDCFGTPITIEADKRGTSPQDIVDEYHAKNVHLFQKLDISYDRYTKTTTENHIALAQQFFLTLLEKEYIFKDTTQQYYSEEENRFLPDRYVIGTCPQCGLVDARSDQCDSCGKVLESGELESPRSRLSGSPVSLKDTEHYFLDWPKLEPFLKKYVQGKGHEWRDWVCKETEGWQRQGLKPRAITRDLDWGVPLPEDQIPEEKKIAHIKNKRLYVWFEAVIGYLSASIEWAEGSKKWKDWWYNKDARHYYFMGKDNLIFHTLFWPGELHAYDENLNLPDVPAINQFLQLEGRQFSKSRGIILGLDQLDEEYGNDPLRFYIASIMPETHDTNFNWDNFARTHNNVLIANLGNFINRTLTLSQDVKMHAHFVHRKALHHTKHAMEKAYDALENTQFKKYVEAILELSSFGNKYMSDMRPWEEKDQDTEKFHKTMASCMHIVLALHALIKPLLPETYEKLSHMIGVDFPQWPNNKELITTLDGLHIENIKPLFKKIEE